VDTKQINKRRTRTLPILVADDIDSDPHHNNRSERIRKVAESFAKRLKTSLNLVHVERFSRRGNPDIKALFKTYISKQERKLWRHSQSKEVVIKPEFIFGDPLQELLRLCTKRDRYELIALATHGRKGVGRIILGSVTEEVIRNSKLPVLSLGPNVKVTGQNISSKEPLKILVATDLGKSSRNAEHYAVGLANRLNAELRLLHCLHEGLHPILQTAFSVPNRPPELTSLYRQMAKDASDALERRKRRYEKLGITVTTKIDERNLTASTSILSEIARSTANLAVMGTHGRNIFAGALLGSSARKVILESPVPTITVK